MRKKGTVGRFGKTRSAVSRSGRPRSGLPGSGNTGRAAGKREDRVRVRLRRPAGGKRGRLTSLPYRNGYRRGYREGFAQGFEFGVETEYASVP
jgi:hypothetical protein